jgi:hypothetical protein
MIPWLLHCAAVPLSEINASSALRSPIKITHSNYKLASLIGKRVTLGVSALLVAFEAVLVRHITVEAVSPLCFLPGITSES